MVKMNGWIKIKENSERVENIKSYEEFVEGV